MNGSIIQSSDSERLHIRSGYSRWLSGQLVRVAHERAVNWTQRQLISGGVPKSVKECVLRLGGYLVFD